MTRDGVRRAMQILLVEVERAWARRDLTAVDVYLRTYQVLARRHLMH